MSATLPERVDAGRMVAARRAFHGSLPVASLPRLKEAIADDRGEVAYDLEFGQESSGVSFVAVRAQARLDLQCQRTLEIFAHPLDVNVRLGLIENEREEARLPAGYEPLLLEEGMVRPARVIEDELLLALPPYPMRQGLAESDGGAQTESLQPDAAIREDNPFAVLRQLKKE